MRGKPVSGHPHKRLPKLQRGWRFVSLGSLIDRDRPITYGVVQPGEHFEGGIPLIRGGDYSGGWRSLGELRRVAPQIEKSFARARLRAGDLVITIKGDVGTCAQVPEWLEGANISQTNARLAIDRGVANPRYVLHFLRSPFGRREVYEHTKVGAQPGLTFGDIESFQVPVPPTISMQDHIAERLDAWDEAIQKIERLIAAKKLGFGALSVSLLKGHKRLSNDKSNWSKCAFNEVTRELEERNSGRFGADAVMGVNKVHGLIPMKEHVRAENLSRYKIVPPNAFAYNPMRLNIGSLAMNTLSREVLVSPDYVVFAARHDRLDYRFFNHLRRSSIWSNFVSSAGTGSVRVRIYYEHLGKLSFHLPSVSIQSQIADVIDTAAYEIEILEKETKLLDRQKRGLAQKFLIGEFNIPQPTRNARSPLNALPVRQPHE